MFFYFVYCLLFTYLSFTVVCILPLLIICSSLTFKQKLLMVLHSFSWPMLLFNPDRLQKQQPALNILLIPLIIY